MELSKRLRLYFWCSAVMMDIFSMTFLLMPIANIVDDIKQKIVFRFTGALFWISMIMGYLFLFLAKIINRRIKREKGMNGEINDNHGKHQNRKWFQKLHLYENVPAAAADTGFITASIVLMVFNYIGRDVGYAVYIDLFILILSFNVHLLFSGDLYKFVIQKDKED